MLALAMLQSSAISAAHLTAGVSFGVGLIILVVGLIAGCSGAVKLSDANVKAAKLKAAGAAAKAQALTAKAVAAAKSDASDESAASDAAKTGEDLAADIGGIVSDFPDTLRFPVLLMLLGIVLMSVGTVQFGGHPIL